MKGSVLAPTDQVRGEASGREVVKQFELSGPHGAHFLKVSADAAGGNHHGLATNLFPGSDNLAALSHINNPVDAVVHESFDGHMGA